MLKKKELPGICETSLISSVTIVNFFINVTLKERKYCRNYAGNLLLFKSFISSIKRILTKVTTRIISIISRFNGVVLKMVSKNGTYTINNCRKTVRIIAPHMPRLANNLLEKRD